MSGRLNLFQSAMLRWRTLHPYCASHVIAVDAPFDEARLREAIAGVLDDCGLAGLELDARRKRFAWRGGPASVSLETLDGGDAPFDAAARVIERTINQPFPAEGRFDPFRFFAVRSGAGFLVGVSYDLKKFTGRVAASADRTTGRQAIADNNSYALDVGGAYNISSRLAVTGGVRYKIEREKVATLSDQRRDSQAVYIGTAIKF